MTRSKVISVWINGRTAYTSLTPGFVIVTIASDTVSALVQNWLEAGKNFTWTYRFCAFEICMIGRDVFFCSFVCLGFSDIQSNSNRKKLSLAGLHSGPTSTIRKRCLHFLMLLISLNSNKDKCFTPRPFGEGRKKWSIWSRSEERCMSTCCEFVAVGWAFGNNKTW